MQRPRRRADASGMSTATSSSLRLPGALNPARARLRALRAPAPELALLLVLAAVLDLWALDRNGWANTYYSAAVRSMSTSWHAFLYNSFDSAGVMTLDKPPLALWVQALSVRAFGMSSWSMLVPQALMGVASTALAYDLTRRRFGRAAGFVAGLVLVTTPITVAISRHNNPDALLVLCSIGALWAIVRALEDGRTRWLVLGGICVGLGFETKMGAALLVLPGLAAAYLWVAPRGRLVAVRQLLAGGAALAVVALAWPVLVWLTPAADRPWVSGTSDNSIWSLIMNYNGLGRIDGQAGGPGGIGGPGGGGGGGAGGVFGGATGPLRLLDASLGGQAGWLIGGALAAGVALVALTRLRRRDARTGWVIAAGGALVTTALAFSFAKGIFHPYYVSLLAPFTAVLVGAGAGVALRGDLAARIVAPLLIAGAVVTELIVINRDAVDLHWAVPLIIVGGLIGAAGGALMSSPLGGRVRGVALAVALGALLLAPASWAVDTLGHATSGTFPAGGPVSQGMDRGPGGGGGFRGGGRGAGLQPPAGVAPPAGFAPPGGGGAGRAFGGPGGPGGGGGGMFGGNQNLTPALAYAKAHGGGTIGVSSQTGAATTIIQSGANVVGLGGFSGRESAVSTSWLAQAVRDGRVRYVLADGSGDGGMRNDGRVGSSSVMAAVQQVGTKTSVSGLYDLQGKADALAALN
jgi:4-amino-4-deoxy-L-arabinose transferase-like glycosyltransferase